MSEPGGEAGLSKRQLATRLFAFTLFFVILFFPNPNPEDVDPVSGKLPPRAQRLAAVTVLMAVLWVSQTIPIAATSLIPLAAFPFLGIQSAKEVSKEREHLPVSRRVHDRAGNREMGAASEDVAAYRADHRRGHETGGTRLHAGDRVSVDVD